MTTRYCGKLLIWCVILGILSPGPRLLTNHRVHSITCISQVLYRLFPSSRHPTQVSMSAISDGNGEDVHKDRNVHTRSMVTPIELQRETAESQREHALSSSMPPNAQVTCLNYKLNHDKAVRKKIVACDREPVISIKHDANNYTIDLDTTMFELVREALSNLVYKPLNTKLSEGTFRSSRNIIYEQHTDASDDDIIATEKITVNNWNAIVKPGAPNLSGPCKIVIHLYRTNTSCLVNGRDASAFMDLLMPQLKNMTESLNASIKIQNGAYKEALLISAESKGRSKRSKVKKPNHQQNTQTLCGNQQATVPSTTLPTVSQDRYDSRQPTSVCRNGQSAPVIQQNSIAPDKELTAADLQMAAAAQAEQQDSKKPTRSDDHLASSTVYGQKGSVPDQTTPIYINNSPKTSRPRKSGKARSQSAVGDDLSPVKDTLSICPVCDQETMEEGVKCDTCEYWLHYACGSISTEEAIASVEEVSTSFVCQSCLLATAGMGSPQNHSVGTIPRRGSDSRCNERTAENIPAQVGADSTPMHESNASGQENNAIGPNTLSHLVLKGKLYQQRTTTRMPQAVKPKLPDENHRILKGRLQR